MISFFIRNACKTCIIISIFLFYLINSNSLTKESLSNQNNLIQIQSQIEEKNSLTKENSIIDEKDESIENIMIQKTKEIWKIYIPKIDLDAEISEGTTKEVLDEYVGHFEDTSKDNGNIGLAAHNRGYNVNYFKDIKKLKEGDEIYYYYGGVERKYYVKRHEIIKDTDWSFLEPSDKNVITLITCVEDEPEYRRCIQAIEGGMIIE